MKLLQNLSIRSKLILVSLIPVIGLLFYLQKTVRKELDNKQAARQLILDVLLIEKLGTLIHDLQKERALSLIYVTLKKDKNREAILDQQENTNKSITELHKFLEENNRTINNLWLLDSLPSFRSTTNTLKFTKRDNQNFLLGKNSILTQINKILRASPSAKLRNNIDDHINLIYAKDLLSQNRSRLAQAILNGKFNERDYGVFSSTKGMHEMNLDKIRKVATPELHEYFEKKFQGPVVQQTYKMIDSAFTDPGLKNIKYDYETWYSNATASINLLKEVENFSSDLIRKKAEQEVALADLSVARSIEMGIGIILVIILIVVYTIRGIINSIAKIKIAANLMSKGNTDIPLDIKSRDEIGNLATSFGEMIKVNKEYALIAAAIGKGDYSAVINVRSNDDVLAKALETLRDNLQKLSNDNYTRNWLLTGNSELNDQMRGEKSAEELAQSIINQLCSYLRAQIGAIYLFDKEHLHLAGSYAFEVRKRNTSIVKLGEGLVGQAALEKKTITFTEVPDDYIKINSGLGNTSPKNIIVFPLLHDEKVRGVIELGFANEFSELNLQFLNSIAENIAIVITSSFNRQSLNESLEKIQFQNMEMEKISMELSQQIGCLNDAAIVSIADAQGDIIYVNDLFTQIAKYSREELLGKNHRILKSGKQPDGLFVAMWEAITSSRTWNGEIMNKAKDGTFYWVDTTISPFKGIDGKIEKYVAIQFDITKQKELTEKLSNLLEETQRQAEELGAQQEELKQTNEELQEKTKQLEESERQLKVQQEELQQTNEELEEQANVLERQKNRLEITKMETENKARELEVISKYKSEFLANMSHELRTPLNSILILSQLLSENKKNVLEKKEQEFAKNIYSSGTDLLNLINEILDLSKVESGKMELEVTEVPFVDLHSDVISMFSEVAKAKSIDLNVIIDEREIQQATIATDKLRLEQILRNLLSNAFKFTEKDGQVTLVIHKPSSDVCFANRKLIPHNVVSFTVQDTGIGIPLEKQEIIFEAFQQADGSTKRKYGGTGLGLSICRELANVLGGEIHLKSEEGEGSSFTLYLPLQFEPLNVVYETKQENKQIEAIPIGKQNKPEKALTANEEIPDDRYAINENDKIVLIMEDDASFAHLLLELIRERHYKGIVALQGNIGLSYARHYKPDAIILDMKLPVMDGTEVLRQLKNDPTLRHIPVQIISGYDLRKQGLELGAFDYVKKPVSRESFENAFDKIENFINQKLKKLLIVEDNKLQNKAIRELIGNGDVKCFSSYSGNEAFEMLKKEKFDCTIVDLGLPDMSGFELLEKIKSDNNLNKIPTIVYTGKDLTKEEASRLSILANTVVLKTVDSHERLLDETILFLHRVESRLPKEKQTIIRKLHKTDEVLKNKLVLVVDDDIRNIYSLTNVLHEEGMNYLIAENGDAALMILKENPLVDIVLMDVMMPEMDGYDATREIRKIAKFEKLPVIALTAKAMKGDREKCLGAGMSDYISKPVNIEQLLSLMRVWLYR